jgi:hypothetical protein
MKNFLFVFAAAAFFPATLTAQEKIVPTDSGDLAEPSDFARNTINHRLAIRHFVAVQDVRGAR